jgi:CHASE2 domain-containing sensor protein
LKEKYSHRISEALVTLVVLCLGLRLATWLVEPLLPALIVMCVVAAVLVVATSRR